MKEQNKFLNFHKVGIIGILLISIMMFDVSEVNALIDDFIIEGGASYINSTYCYGDYLYILNNTELQKWSIQSRTIVDTIDFPLLTDVTELLRKGSRIYIDAEVNTIRTIICVDIEPTESFEVLATTDYDATLTYDWYYTINFKFGLCGVEYYDCNGHDFWLWHYANASDGASKALWQGQVFRGTYEMPSITYQRIMLTDAMYVGVEWGGNTYVHLYMYNVTSGVTTSLSWTHAGLDDHRTYYHQAQAYFNHTSNTWEKEWLDRQERSYLGGAQYTGNNEVWKLSYSLQYDNQPRYNSSFFEPELYGTAFRGGWRSNDYELTNRYTLNNLHTVWMDTDERTAYLTNVFGSKGKREIHIARFDTSTFPLGTYKTPDLVENPNTQYQMHGVAGMVYLANSSQLMNAYIGYVNDTDKFPVVDWIIEVSGADCIRVGAVDGNFTISDSKVFQASKNLIALYVIDGSNDIIVHRNLIPREELGEGGYGSLNFLNATIYTVLGDDRVLNDGWLFMGEIYQLESYIVNTTTFYIELDDGENTLRYYFNNNTHSLNITTSQQFLGGIIDANIELVDALTETYVLTWTFILNRNIVDCSNISMTYWGINEPESSTIAGTAITDINIYNLGGLTYYEFVGDGGRTSQGTPFELYATNGSLSSSAKAEQIFRKLQSVHFLMELDMSNEWDAGNGEFDIDAGIGYVDIGLDYRLNGSWIDGFKIRLYVQDADVGHHGIGSDNNWIEWSTDFYNYDPYYDDVVNLQSQLIYSNHWGYENEDLSPDYHNRTSAQLWIDLWFDRTNASTTIATQVNSYYHGMKEHGSSWWFGYGVFQPMISDYDNAKFLDDLYDEEGEISNCQKIELVKFWIEVGKVDIVDGNDETWIIRGIEDMNREQAIDRMMGIDEPTFVQTKVLDMPQTGFINAIKTAINNLSATIWLGALQFVKILMSSVGYLMNAIGLGVWWESFSIMLGNIATVSLNFMEELEVALINSALLVEQIFRVLSVTIIRYTYAVTSFISSILLWYEYIIDMFTGGGIFSIDIWASLQLGDFFILFMHLSPVLWINRLNNADDFIGTLQGDIRFIIMMVTGLFSFMSSVIVLTMTLINILLGMLPI